VKSKEQKRALQATAVGALLFVLYILLNVTGMPPAEAVPPHIFHVAALILGLGLMAWAGAPKTGTASESDAEHSCGVKDLARIVGQAIDASDPFSRGRSYRFVRFCSRLGRELGLPQADLSDLETAALLHDLGRVAIDQGILYKPGSLDDGEREIVRSHPLIAYEILKGIPSMERVAEIVYAHHEQPDGRGYPRKLRTSGIPLASAIIMVVAAFDSMTSDRPYRSGLSPTEAYEELQKSRGTMFFPRAVDAFIKLHSSSAIFEDFEEEEILKYAQGEYPSRALEDYLKTRKREKDEDQEDPAA
jgi:HD-GYP domain-containing protein (c-di-GMP phosphodiesterase class II)